MPTIQSLQKVKFIAALSQPFKISLVKHLSRKITLYKNHATIHGAMYVRYS